MGGAGPPPQAQAQARTQEQEQASQQQRQRHQREQQAEGFLRVVPRPVVEAVHGVSVWMGWSCPVDHEGDASSAGASAGAPPGCGAAAGGADACPSASSPVGGVNPLNMMPAGDQQQHAGQTLPLSTRREMSSIKRNTAEGPVHQPEGHSRWMYPSQQMFFNAMKRKGWDPQEQDMPSVVAIHNAVNERAWGQVLEWEALHEGDCGSRRVRLKSFSGDAKKLSPRARFLMAMGYSAPFDRHDWVVDRCGTDVRYVVDFYNAPALPGQAAAIHIDLRPSLDGPQAFMDRAAMWAYKAGLLEMPDAVKRAGNLLKHH